MSLRMKCCRKKYCKMKWLMIFNLGYRSDGKWYWNKSNTLCGFGNCWGLDGSNGEYWGALNSNGYDVTHVKSVLNYPICQM